MDDDLELIQGFYCEMPSGEPMLSRQPLALAIKCKPLRLAKDTEELVAYTYNATAESDITLNFRYLSFEPPWHPYQCCWGLTWKS
jgi:hypothetical protein